MIDWLSESKKEFAGIAKDCIELKRRLDAARTTSGAPAMLWRDFFEVLERFTVQLDIKERRE